MAQIISFATVREAQKQGFNNNLTLVAVYCHLVHLAYFTPKNGCFEIYGKCELPENIIYSYYNGYKIVTIYE